METVVLVIHLLLALTLIGVVLMQRSEGGGLGMGGGGGVMSGRSAATALGKVTWLLAIAFIATSLTLTVLAARSSGTGSVLDRITDTAPAAGTPAPADDGSGLLPPVPSGESLLPPGGAPAPAADAAPETGDSLAPEGGATGDGLTPQAN